MNGIDPKYVFWLGVLVSVELGIGQGVVPLSDMFPADWVHWIKGWSAGLAFVGATIMTALTGYSSSKPGPLVKALLIAFALSFLVVGGSAQAAQLKPLQLGPDASAAPADSKCLIPWDPLKLCGTLTGKPEEDMQRIVKRIQAVGRDDMNYAMLKAKAANTNASKVRLQCLQSIMDSKDAAEGVAIKDAQGNVVPRPDPAVVTAIEDVAELVDALAPGGPLITGCAGAAQLLKLNTLQAINGIVTGAAGIAAMPVGL